MLNVGSWVPSEQSPTTETAASPIITLNAEAASRIEIPGDAFLLSATFERAGPDLVLTSDGGETVVVRDYFAAGEPAALVTSSGVFLSGEMVSRLAGPLAPAQVAQAAPVPGGEPIGVVETVQGKVIVIRADGTRDVIAKGDMLFQGDVLETGAEAAVGLILADETAFSLGADGRMVLDEMVYDPATETGSASIAVVQGVFTFVSGQIAKTGMDAMVISTPTVDIGVRGTAGAGRVEADGVTTVALMEENGGITGELVFINSAGVQTLNQAFHAVTVGAVDMAPSSPVAMSAEDVGRSFGDAIRHLPDLENHLPEALHRAVLEAPAAAPEGSDSPLGDGAFLSQGNDAWSTTPAEAGEPVAIIAPPAVQPVAEASPVQITETEPETTIRQDAVSDTPETTVNTAPILDASKVLKPKVIHDEATNPSEAGVKVSDVLADSITDAGDPQGVAVVGLIGQGLWEYSINGGSTWTAFGPVTEPSATLLAADAYVRFLPSAGFNGGELLTFRAWDQSSGANGDTGVDTTLNGGETAFSPGLAAVSGMDVYQIDSAAEVVTVATNVTPTVAGVTPAEINSFSSGDDMFRLLSSLFGGITKVDGTNFSVIGAEYDGTNGTSGEYAADRPSFLLDGDNNLIYDDNGDQAGYTVVATLNTNTLVAADMEMM
jgi:hypothetical protein